MDDTTDAVSISPETVVIIVMRLIVRCGRPVELRTHPGTRTDPTAHGV
ncbi:hypothetical protein ABZ816_24765 [Actinosynnema sp. NPDC047251]|nr:hypothetical protein [Saccharothrix espanaensis]